MSRSIRGKRIEVGEADQVSRISVASSKNDPFVEPIACQSGRAAAAGWETDQEGTQDAKSEERDFSPNPPRKPFLVVSG